jgi:serine/threonine-protein kinase RsbW
VSDAPPTAIAHLRLPADPRYLAVARLAMAGVASRLEIGDHGLEDLKFVLSEAIANAIRHGYAGGPGEVEVDFAVGPHEVEVTVRDGGCGFDAEHAASGIGLTTMRALVSRLEIDSTPGGGTRLTFARALPA